MPRCVHASTRKAPGSVSCNSCKIGIAVDDISGVADDERRQDSIERIIERETERAVRSDDRTVAACAGSSARPPMAPARAYRASHRVRWLVLRGAVLRPSGGLCRRSVRDWAEATGADGNHDYVTAELARDRTPDEAYWLQQLEGEVPNFDLPLDHKRPAIRSRNGALQTLRIEPDVYKQIKAVGARRGATLFQTLLAAFEVLMFRLSGQDDLVLGIPIAGQSELENGHLVAHCVATLPLRCRVDPNATFTQFLKRLRTTFLEGQAHPHVTFGSLLSKLTIERDISRPALVSVVFNIDRIGAAFDFGDLSLERVETPKRFVTFDLNVNVVDSGHDLLIECDYNSDILEADTIRRWLGHMSMLLGAIVRDPEQTIGRIDILGAQERHHLMSVPAVVASAYGSRSAASRCLRLGCGRRRMRKRWWRARSG